MTAKCKVCGKIKPKEEFVCNKWKDRKYYYICNECNNAISLHRYKLNPKRVWCSSTLSNHKRCGYDIQITLDELYEFVKDKDYCYICGKELDWSYGNKQRKPNKNSPTLDRLNNDYYININNIQILCTSCNVMKSDKTIEELIEWCKQVINIYGE